MFINPVVASLPEHLHLFAEDGCYKEKKAGKIVHRKCGFDGSTEEQATESKLPKSFQPLKLNREMDLAWEKLVFSTRNQ